MKRILLMTTALVLALMLIISGCSTNLGISEEAKLKRELRKFEQFSGSGVVELSVFGMSLHKNFALAKSMDQMRFDMIDGGVFGTAPSPLLSVYLGQYLSLKSTLMPALEALNLQDKLPMKPNAIFNTADHIVERFGNEIIQTKKVVRDSLTITFRKNYQLESIVDTDAGIRVDASYTRKGDLDVITLKVKGISAKMTFDKVVYDHPQITPLPKAEPKQEDFFKIFQQGGMMDMFKGLLGN